MRVKIGRRNMFGHVEGKVGDYTFSAKVVDNPSKSGINKGRTIKLTIRHKDRGYEDVAHYDRGWDVRPKAGKDKRVYDAIVSALEIM